MSNGLLHQVVFQMDVNITEACREANFILNLTDPDYAYQFLFDTFDVLLITIIVPVVSLLGIFGNGAFLFTTLRVKELRDATVTIYLTNLAVCDILFLIFVNTWYVASYLSSPLNSSYPVFSTFGCGVWVVTTHWWYLGSLAFITLITIERYFAICKPILHRNFGGKSVKLKIVCVTWILSLCFTLTGVPQYSRSIMHCIVWPKAEEFQDFPATFYDCDPESNAADVMSICLSY